MMPFTPKQEIFRLAQNDTNRVISTGAQRSGEISAPDDKVYKFRATHGFT